MIIDWNQFGQIWAGIAYVICSLAWLFVTIWCAFGLYSKRFTIAWLALNVVAMFLITVLASIRQ